MLKKRPPQFTGFVEDIYRHEHVMITNLYIVSHILYDATFINAFFGTYCACLEEAWIYICIPLRCHCSTSWCSKSGIVAAGRDTSHVPAGLEFPRCV